MAMTPRVDTLSFVSLRKDGGGFDYWAVEGTGSYGSDCAKGRELALKYLAFVGSQPNSGNATLLACIVDSMMAKRSQPHTAWGRHTTGLETAFLNTVNEYAMASAAMLNRSNTAA